MWARQPKREEGDTSAEEWALSLAKVGSETAPRVTSPSHNKPVVLVESARGLKARRKTKFEPLSLDVGIIEEQRDSTFSKSSPTSHITSNKRGMMNDLDEEIFRTMSDDERGLEDLGYFEETKTQANLRSSERKKEDRYWQSQIRGNRQSRDTYYELSSSGTLKVPGFMVRASGLEPSSDLSTSKLNSREAGDREERKNAANDNLQVIGRSLKKTSAQSRSKRNLLAVAAANRTLHFDDEVHRQIDTELGKNWGDTKSEDRAFEAREMERKRGYVFSEKELIFIKRLGKGASGVVRLAKHIPSQKLVAVKEVPVFDDGKRAQMVSELKTLQKNLLPISKSKVATSDGATFEDLLGSSGCEFIVGMYDCYVNKSDSTINLVLEWMDGGSVQDVLDERGGLDDSQIALMIHCSLRGLQFLHRSRQLHRDIKPSNLLISKSTGLVKLSDFGVSHSFGSFSAANTFVGSLSYMAPERINGDEEGYSYPSDVWSLGLTTFVCAAGQHPYQTEYDDQGYWGLVHAIGEQPSPTLSSFGRSKRKHSDQLCSFVDCCLRKDPQSRLTIDELLAHPFLASIFPLRTYNRHVMTSLW